MNIIKSLIKYIKQEKLLIIAVSIALAGYFIGSGIYHSLNKRTVTVKGLSEKLVKADTAVWNIKINNTGYDLAKLQVNTDKDVEKIKSFLKNAGFNDEEIQNLRIYVSDRNSYSEKENSKDKYLIETGVVVKSHNIDLVDKTSRLMGDLIRKGVKITEDYEGPMYIFNGLNNIKIEMIEEATKNATKAGKQFALDTNAKLGKIMTANQGVFHIEASDGSHWERRSINKKVRVVSTITFYLR